MNVTASLEILRLYLTLGEKLMPLLDDIKAVSDEADAAIARGNADADHWKQQIADLEAQVASGGSTPEVQAALGALKAKLAAFDLDPNFPPPATPTP